MSDYFNEFLVNEWNVLDKELSQDHFMTHEQERQEAIQQQETQQARTPDESESIASEEEMRETYNRKESKESKQERLTRIKDEYSRPFVSVGCLGFPQRRRRRMLKLLDILKDTEYPQAVLEQPVMDGTAGSGPGRGLTQLVEQNESTIMPIARSNKTAKNQARVYDFLVAWNEEIDPQGIIPIYIPVEALEKRGVDVSKAFKQLTPKQLKDSPHKWITIGWGLPIENGFEGGVIRYTGTEKEIREKMRQDAVELASTPPDQKFLEESLDEMFQNPDALPWPQEPGWEDEITLTVSDDDYNVVHQQQVEPINVSEEEEWSKSPDIRSPEEYEKQRNAADLVREWNEAARALKEEQENKKVFEERHEKIEEPMPGEILTPEELEEMFKRSGLKRLCKRAV